MAVGQTNSFVRSFGKTFDGNHDGVLTGAERMEFLRSVMGRLGQTTTIAATSSSTTTPTTRVIPTQTSTTAPPYDRRSKTVATATSMYTQSTKGTRHIGSGSCSTDTVQRPVFVRHSRNWWTMGSRRRPGLHPRMHRVFIKIPPRRCRPARHQVHVTLR